MYKMIKVKDLDDQQLQEHFDECAHRIVEIASSIMMLLDEYVEGSIIFANEKDLYDDFQAELERRDVKRFNDLTDVEYKFEYHGN